MRCSYCQEQAGWFAKLCTDCARLLALYKAHKGKFGLLQFLDLFIETGLPRQKIEAFLDADPHNKGSIKDCILADMSTELLGAMGINVQQKAEDVKRLRESGNWKGMGERPKE